jgi:hypothetical protein
MVISTSSLLTQELRPWARRDPTDLSPGHRDRLPQLSEDVYSFFSFYTTVSFLEMV